MLQNPSSLVSGAQRLGDTLMRLSAGYGGRSLPERASDATRELIQYGQALQAKKLAVSPFSTTLGWSKARN